MSVTSRGTCLDFSESLPLSLHPQALNFTYSLCKSGIRRLLVSVLAEPQALSARVSTVSVVGALLSHPAVQSAVRPVAHRVKSQGPGLAQRVQRLARDPGQGRPPHEAVGTGLVLWGLILFSVEPEADEPRVCSSVTARMASLRREPWAAFLPWRQSPVPEGGPCGKDRCFPGRGVRRLRLAVWPCGPVAPWPGASSI